LKKRNILALNALVKRGSLSAIGEDLGVGKESVVYEGLREMGGAWASSRHSQVPQRGAHEFQAGKAQREHLDGMHHFSWVYTARLAAKREFEVLQRCTLR